MIVVDTSIWIGLLNDDRSPKVERCAALIRDRAPVAMTDIVFTEILQGLRSDREASKVERYLRAFPILRLEGLEDFARAAELYRTARHAGITIRKTLDCLIAAPCIRADAPLLHDDDDFDRLASCTPLEIFSVV